MSEWTENYDSADFSDLQVLFVFYLNAFRVENHLNSVLVSNENQ